MEFENGIQDMFKPNADSPHLQNCPFCGKDAKVKVYGHKHTNGDEPYFAVTYQIGCFDCGITFTHESQFTANKDGRIHVLVDGYKIVTDKWNKRAGKSNGC